MKETPIRPPAAAPQDPNEPGPPRTTPPHRTTPRASPRPAAVAAARENAPGTAGEDAAPSREPRGGRRGPQALGRAAPETARDLWEGGACGGRAATAAPGASRTPPPAGGGEDPWGG